MSSATDPGRPLWLLDVDGVLNAVTSRPDPGVWPDWRQGTARAEGIDWPICFSPTVARTIARLHEAGLAEVRWLTTWGHDANGDLRRLLGLPAFDVAFAPPRHDEPSAAAKAAGAATGVLSHGQARVDTAPVWWKLRAVQHVVRAEPDRPVIWTDDDLRFEAEAVAWAEQHLARRLLIAPWPLVGLTSGQLRAVREFCGAPAAES